MSAAQPDTQPSTGTVGLVTEFGFKDTIDATADEIHDTVWPAIEEESMKASTGSQLSIEAVRVAKPMHRQTLGQRLR